MGLGCYLFVDDIGGVGIELLTAPKEQPQRGGCWGCKCAKLGIMSRLINTRRLTTSKTTGRSGCRKSAHLSSNRGASFDLTDAGEFEALVRKPMPPSQDIRLERCCAFLGLNMLNLDVGHAVQDQPGLAL